MSAGVVLRTTRLLLRPLTTRDAEDLALLANDLDVARMTARIPHPYTVTEAFRWVASIEDEEFVRAIVLDSLLVGVVGVAVDDVDEECAEIGYWLGKPYWMNGYATEAAHALCCYSFDVERLARLTSSHFVGNEGSRNVLLKLGFRAIGQRRVWCEARQQELDAISYELSRRRFRDLSKQ